MLRQIVAFLPLLVACGSGGGSSSNAGQSTDGGAPDDAPGSPTSDGAGPSDAAASGDATDAHAGGADAAGDAGCGAPESLIPAWVGQFVPTQEIYVAPSGSDSNPGTKAAPLKTSTAAFAKLQPGTRLNFAAGTYGCGYISNFAGSQSAPGAIVSSDGPLAAKFDCGGGSNELYLSAVRGFIIDGIELFDTGTGFGIQIDSGSWLGTGKLAGDIAILHSYIHDNGLANVKVAQSDGLTVVDCKLEKAGQTTAGRQNLEFVAVDDVTIAGNEATNSTGAFDEVKGGARHGRIYRNYVHDTAGGILVGGDCTGQQFLVHTTADYEATDLRVWDNVIANEDSEAFRIVGCHDCTVENNTYWSTKPVAMIRVVADAFAPAGSSTCSVQLHNQMLTIRNNLFAASSPVGDMIPTSETGPVSGWALDHNAWWDGTGNDVTKVYSDIPFTGDSASLYSVDPKLVMPPSNLRPSAGSPVVGKGSAPPYGPGNADGVCWSGSPNIGAY